MSYEDAFEWLFTIRRFGPERTLEPTRHVLDLLDNPQESFGSIHVGGTNGKGSTSAMIASILQSAGYKTGLYTSPHLEDFRERVRINGEMIPESDMTRLLFEVKKYFDEMLAYPNPMPLRFFDIVTTVCFKYFQEQNVDLAVIEVGLGGRLDATNILNPLVSVITNIGYEHVNILGPTLQDIAYEKGGIIKENTPLVTAEADDCVFKVFQEKAETTGSKILRVSDVAEISVEDVSNYGQQFDLTTNISKYAGLTIPLYGEHQQVNAATAVITAEVLNQLGKRVEDTAIRGGLSQVKWPGRLEVLGRAPLIVLDCAKDAEATEVVQETINSMFDYKRLVAVVSMSSDKNIEGMIAQVAKVADHFIITKHSVTARAAEPEVLIAAITKAGKTFQVQLERESAFDLALSQVGPEDMLLVIGSVYLAGDARSHFASRLTA